jgi:Rrf2 family protein
MSVIFSKGCEYALQSMIYLASQPRDTPVLQRDISNSLDIPAHFLGKILQLLSHKGLVISYKGKTGGFLLGRSPKNISLYDVVEVIDGTAFLDGCVLGFPACGDANPCPVHPQWKKNKEQILQILKNKNIEQLSKEIDIKLNLIRSQRIKQFNKKVAV